MFFLNFIILLAACMIALGCISVSWNWKESDNTKIIPTNKRLFRINCKRGIAIIVGSVLTAGGGILGTWGWNFKSALAEKSTLIETFAAELMININIFSSEEFNETDKSLMKKAVVFPRFQTTGLKALISSGLFLTNDDKELFTRVTDLAEKLENINRRLDITEDLILEAKIRGDNEFIITWREKLRDGETRKQIGPLLNKLGELLMEKYGIDKDKRFFVDLNSKQYK
ncbi:MAG: hypothetical protein JXA79_12155 [Deltaproteobacteria bacterium]|nr:hypothetical protein [Deltaproteobacteria bacterium]